MKHRPVQDAVADLVADQVAAGRHLGVQVAAWFEGEPVVDVAAGWLDSDRTRPVRHDSLFSLFSVTKALAALALWRLVERDELDLDARRGAATVEQLLSHQGGLHRVPPDIDTAFLADLDRGLAWLAAQEAGVAAGHRRRLPHAQPRLDHRDPGPGRPPARPSPSWCRTRWWRHWV